MSIPARADRRPNGLQSDAKEGGMSGADGLEPARRDAHGRRRLAPESVSRFSAQEWDALSVSRPNRKVHPAISRYSGSGFPKQPQSGKRDPLWTKIPGCSFREAHIKEKDPFAEALVNSRWRGRESRPRCARADRCGAFAPCELRWQTLSRLLSSAPSRGSIPRGSHIKEKDPFAEVLVNSRWRGRESNP